MPLIRDIARFAAYSICFIFITASSCAESPVSGSGNEKAQKTLEKTARDAGMLQGNWYKRLRAETKGMNQEDAQKWNQEHFGEWYEANKNKNSQAYFEDFYNFAKENLDNKLGFEALAMALEAAAGSDIDYHKIQDIHELLYKHYRDNPGYSYITQLINSGQSVGHKPPTGTGENAWAKSRPERYKRVVSLLDRVAKNSTNPAVQAHVMLALGDYMSRSANYLDENQSEEAATRRVRAENLLRNAILISKKNDVILYMPNNIRAMKIYNEAFKAANAEPLDEEAKAKAVAREKRIKEMKIPPIYEIAERKLQELQLLASGKPAPDSKGEDMDGNIHSIFEYRGRVVMVDFWATWCAPCIAKFPHMKELKAKYAGRPFEILGISADNDKEDVVDFLEDDNLPWDIWYSGMDKGIVKEWQINAFPTVYIIDADSNIIIKNPSEEKLEEIIERLVQEAEKKASIKY